MSNAKRDDNRVTTAIGVSSIDLATPITIAVNPSTHAVLIDSASILPPLDARYLQILNNLSDLNSTSTARGNLGLGTIATQNANNVNITGGSITGITDLLVADGGTGASTAAGARTNLGLDSGGAGDIWVHRAGDTMTGALTITTGGLTVTAGGIVNTAGVLTSEGGNTLINQLNGAYDFKVGGNSKDGMLWVRSGFDRVGIGVASVDYFFHVGGDTKIEGIIQGAAIENGDVLINQLVQGFDFKVGGDTNSGMIWVRKNFDRIGFGIAGANSVDNPFDVNLDAKFRTVVAIGDAGPDAGKILNIDKTTTATDGDKFGVNSIFRTNPGADTDKTYFGGFIEAQTVGGNTHNLTSGLRGLKVFAEHNGTGTVTNATGAESQVRNESTGTITNAISFNILKPDLAGGATITTNYGLLIDDQNVGTTGYAIVTGRGDIKLMSNAADHIGFFAATPVVQQTDGAALTNSVTTGGTTDTIADFTSLTIYATDAATIRNDIYQLARKVKIIGDALRAYGLLS